MFATLNFWANMIEIPNFPNYFITDNGDVFSTMRSKLPKRLASRFDKQGYRFVHLQHNGEQVFKLVHRIVAEVFVPNPDNLPCVLHKDDNPGNPHKDNLFWGTHTDNMQDKVHKRRDQNCRVLTEDQVKHLRSLPLKHGMFAKLSKEWGVNAKRLRYAYHGKTYTHI